MVRLIINIYEKKRKITFRSTNVCSIRDLKFDITAIAVTISGLASRLPFVAILFFANYMSQWTAEKLELALSACTIPAIFNNASTFFLNFISNSNFYDEFLTMIGLRKRSSS